MIEAIGHGEAAYGRIASRSGVKGNTLTAALAALIETKGMVARGAPLCAAAGQDRRPVSRGRPLPALLAALRRPPHG